MEPFLQYEQQGGVVTLTLNRPDIRNALIGAEDGDEILAACDRINADPSVRAVILTGAGSCFCAGGDIRRMREQLGSGLGEPTRSRQAYRHGIQRIPLALQSLEVPCIAAVNGPAIGAGCDLATMCDIRIAADNASFAESFVKVGLVPGDGGAWLLPRAVGLSRAFEMAFTGDTIDAQQALAWGLVSHVVPAAQLMDAARALAARIAANPGQVLRLTKRLILEGQHTRLDTLLELSASFQALSHWTAEHEAAVDAFISRRAPRPAPTPDR